MQDHIALKPGIYNVQGSFTAVIHKIEDYYLLSAVCQAGSQQ